MTTKQYWNGLVVTKAIVLLIVLRVQLELDSEAFSKVMNNGLRLAPDKS